MDFKRLCDSICLGMVHGFLDKILNIVNLSFCKEKLEVHLLFLIQNDFFSTSSVLLFWILYK